MGENAVETLAILRGPVLLHDVLAKRVPVRVYIAGPYTKGDVAINVRNAILAADRVLKAGHIPFVPHLTHFWHLVCPGGYQQWIDLDLAWLAQCRAFVRLPGESQGADVEEAWAEGHGLSVFHGVDAFLEWSKNSKRRNV